MCYELELLMVFTTYNDFGDIKCSVLLCIYVNYVLYTLG